MKSVLIIMTLILSTTLAEAQQSRFDLVQSQRRSANYLYLEGILPDANSTQGIDLIKKIKEAIASGNNLVLVLNMDGGDLDTAYQIRDLIRQNQDKVRTVMPNTSVCTSACITIYTADDDRCASTESFFGFHSCRTEGVPSKEATEVYIDRLVEDGVSREWVDSDFRNGDGFNEILKRSNELTSSGVTRENCENVVPPAVINEIQQKRTGVSDRLWRAAPWSRVSAIRIRPRSSEAPILDQIDDLINNRSFRIQGPMSLPPTYSEELPSSVEVIQ